MSCTKRDKRLQPGPVAEDGGGAGRTITVNNLDEKKKYSTSHRREPSACERFISDRHGLN